MYLYYPVLVSALPANRRTTLARLISQSFNKMFGAERLLEFEKAAVCQVDGHFIAVACVREKKQYAHPTVECVCVAHEHRRKGVGRELMKCVLSDLGYDALMLHVDADAPCYRAATSMYREAGFVEIMRDEAETTMQWERGS